MSMKAMEIKGVKPSPTAPVPSSNGLVPGIPIVVFVCIGIVTVVKRTVFLVPIGPKLQLKMFLDMRLRIVRFVLAD